jgi:hypothetical protein
VSSWLTQFDSSGSGGFVMQTSWSPTSTQWNAFASAGAQRIFAISVPIQSSIGTLTDLNAQSMPFFYLAAGAMAFAQAGALPPPAPWRLGEAIPLQWTYRAFDASQAAFDVSLVASDGSATRIALINPSAPSQRLSSVTISSSFTFPINQTLSGDSFDFLAVRRPAGPGAISALASAANLARALLPPLLSITSPAAGTVISGGSAGASIKLAWTGSSAVLALRLNVALCILADPNAAAAALAATASTSTSAALAQPCVQVMTLATSRLASLPAVAASDSTSSSGGGLNIPLPTSASALMAGTYFVRVTSPLDAPAMVADSIAFSIAVPRTVSVVRPASGVALTAGADVLSVWFSTTSVLSTTQLRLSLVLASAAASALATAAAVFELGSVDNAGTFNWAIPFAPAASAAGLPSAGVWPGAAAPFVVRVCDRSIPSDVVCAASASFTIAAQSAQARVLSVSTILPSQGAAAGAPITVSWSISGAPTSLPVTVELMAARYAFAGGDVSLGVATSGNAGASTFSWNVDPATPLSSPVYALVSVPGQGLWGRSAPVVLQPPPELQGATLSGGVRRLQPLSPSGAMAAFLNSVCAAPGRPVDAGMPWQLCMQTCGACVAAGGTWATLAAASLSFSADGLGPAAALSRAGFEQLGALLGAFSALGVSACLPSRADLSVGPVALTYARLATQQLVPLAVGAPAATLTIAPGPTYTYSTAGMSAGACSLPPSIYASVAVTGAAPGAAPAAVAMGAAQGFGLAAAAVTPCGTTAARVGRADAKSGSLAAAICATTADATALASTLQLAATNLRPAVIAQMSGVGSFRSVSCAFSNLIALSSAQLADVQLASAAAVMQPPPLTNALAAANARPLTGANVAALRSSAQTDGSANWTATTASARSPAGLAAAIATLLVPPPAPPAAAAAASSPIALIAGAAGGGVALIAGVALLVWRRRAARAAEEQRQMVLAMKGSAYSGGGGGGYAGEGGDVAFENPMNFGGGVRYPHEVRVDGPAGRDGWPGDGAPGDGWRGDAERGDGDRGEGELPAHGIVAPHELHHHAHTHAPPPGHAHAHAPPPGHAHHAGGEGEPAAAERSAADDALPGEETEVDAGGTKSKKSSSVSASAMPAAAAAPALAATPALAPPPAAAAAVAPAAALAPVEDASAPDAGAPAEAEDPAAADAKARARAALDADELPPGWSWDQTEEGEMFFVRADGSTVWDDPRETWEVYWPCFLKAEKKKKKDKKESKLPPGWVKRKTDDGETYYENEDSGETSWKKPRDKKKKKSDKSWLADTWEERETDDGAVYYENTRTGETTWDVPKGFVPKKADDDDD